MTDKAPHKLALLEKVKMVGSWEECRDLCHDNTKCDYFVFKVSNTYTVIVSTDTKTFANISH